MVDPTSKSGGQFPRRSHSFSATQICVAALGDAMAIVAFAALGRTSHHSSGNPVSGSLETAGPFLVGWFVAAIMLGAFMPKAFSTMGNALRSVFRCWLLGCTVALGLRSIGEHRVVPISFALIAFVANLAFLSIWRSAFVKLLTPRLSGRSR